MKISYHEFDDKSRISLTPETLAEAGFLMRIGMRAKAEQRAPKAYVFKTDSTDGPFLFEVSFDHRANSGSRVNKTTQ